MNLNLRISRILFRASREAHILSRWLDSKAISYECKGRTRIPIEIETRKQDTDDSWEEE